MERKELIDKIRGAYWSIIPYNYRPHQLIYRFKCWGWHRYSTIKPRYLPHTWCDKDDVLAHCMFEILSRFVEDECNPEIIDWYHKDENGEFYKTIKRGKQKINVRDEIQDLYDWWHNVYIPWDENRPESEEWSKFNDLHRVKNANGEFDLSFDFKYDSEESEQKSRELLENIWNTEENMNKELKKRLHRIINVMDHLWT